jgi:hypothetical protein
MNSSRYVAIVTIAGNVGLAIAVVAVLSPWIPRDWTVRSYEVFLLAGAAAGALVGWGIAEGLRRRGPRA